VKLKPTDAAEHSSKQYPMEVGAPKFDPVPVLEEKDRALNVARLQANHEYKRIMQQARVLVKQAEELQNRLDIAEQVHQAEFGFSVTYGKTYHLYYCERRQKNVLCQQGPKEWTTGVPESWQHLFAVRKLGDSTWEEVIEEKNNGNI
jgi:hypothetical protein